MSSDVRGMNMKIETFVAIAIATILVSGILFVLLHVPAA